MKIPQFKIPTNINSSSVLGNHDFDIPAKLPEAKDCIVKLVDKGKKAILGLTCPTKKGDEVETIIRQQVETLKKQGVENIIILTHSNEHLGIAKKLIGLIPELKVAVNPEDITTLSNRNLIKTPLGRIKITFDEQGNIIK